jgi:hypothetical protein
MIENFLLDPEVLWEAIESVRDRTVLDSVTVVEAALGAILDELSEHEVERRVLQGLGYRRFQPERPVNNIPQQVAEFSEELATSFGPEKVNKCLQRARVEVDELKAKSQRREHFDGKRVLKEFFNLHLHSASISKEIFTYYAAKRAAKRSSVKVFFDAFFAKVLAAPAANGHGTS